MAFHYVTAAGGTTKDGSSWTNAWASNAIGSPASGDTVLLGAGNYTNGLGPFTSGVTYTAVSSTAIGLGTSSSNVSNGTTQQVILPGSNSYNFASVTNCTLTGGLWIPPWKPGGATGPPSLYGILINNAPASGNNIISPGNGNSFINLEISGPTPNANGYNLTTSQLSAFFGGTNALISGCKIHDMDGPFYYLMGGSVIEYCTIYNVSSDNQITGNTSEPHPDLSYNNQTSVGASNPFGYVLRYNVWANCVSEGIFFDNFNTVAGGSFINLIMYGNLMFQGDTAGTVSGGASGQCDAIEIKTQAGNFGAFYIYNNTFVDWGVGSKPGLNSDGAGTISHFTAIQNNLFANTTTQMDTADSGNIIQSNNGYYQASKGDTPADGHPIALTTSPFPTTGSHPWTFAQASARLGPAPNTQTRPIPLGYDPTPYIPSFQLAAGSLAIGQAINLSAPASGNLGITHTLNVDMFGNTGSNLGAFQPSSSVTPSFTTIGSTFGQGNMNAKSGSGSISCPFNFVNISGNCIVVFLTSDGSGISISDSKVNTYSLITSNSNFYIYLSNNIISGVNTVTANITGGTFSSIQILEYFGITDTSPVDVFNSATGSASTSCSISCTTTNPNDIIICGIAEGATDSLVAGAGFTIRTSFNISHATGASNFDVCVEDAATTTSGVKTASATWTGSGAFVAIILALKLTSTTTPVPAVASLSNYVLAFNDEFTGPLNIALGTGFGSIPPAKWIAHTPYVGDFGTAYFTGPNEPNGDGTGLIPPNPFSTLNGILNIQTYHDTVINHDRTGLIATVDTTGSGFSALLGYFEIRCQLPGAQGVWPSFWLNTINSVQTPARTTNSVEIDIFEMYGIDMTKLHQTVHNFDPSGNQVTGTNTGGSTTVTIASPVGAFHIFSCLVNSDLIHFYYDGVETFNIATPLPAQTLPMYALVDLGQGGGFTVDETALPQVMQVDYVRIFTPPPAIAAFVQGNMNAKSASGSISCPFNGGNAAGNCIVVFVQSDGTGITISDSAGNTSNYTLITSQGSFFAYLANNVVSGANTVTANITGGTFSSIQLLEYSGILDANPVDATGTNTGTLATSCSVSCTTTYSNDMLICGVSEGATDTLVAGPSFTLRTSFNIGHASGSSNFDTCVEDSPAPVAKVQTATATWTGSGAFVAILVALKTVSSILQTAPTAPAFIQVNSATPQTATSPVTVAFTSAQTAGNANVVIVGFGDLSVTLASTNPVVDTKGNVYTVAVPLARGPNTGTPVSQAIYTAHNIAAGANTVTVTFSSAPAFPDIRIAEYSNISTAAGYVDATASASGTSTAFSSGALNTTVINDMLVSGNVVGDTTISSGGGFTIRSTTTDGDIIEDQLASTVGSYTGSATGNASNNWIMQTVALKAAVSAPTFNTVTVNFSGNASTVDINYLEYRNIVTTSPLDIGSNNSGTSATPSTLSFSTQNPSDIIVGASTSATGILSGGTGYIKRTGGTHSCVEDNPVTSTGTYSAGSNLSVSSQWIQQAVALKAAGSFSSITVPVTGVASAQAFTIFTVTVPIGVTGIPSAQAFGTFTTNAPATRTVTGVLSAEAFTVYLDSAPALRAITGIVSAESFTAYLVSAPALLTVTGIVSAQAFSTPTVAAPGLFTVTGIPSIQAFGPIIIPSISIVTGVVSGQAFSTVSVLSPGQFTVTGITSAEAFSTVLIAALASVTGIVSGESFSIVNVTSPGQFTVTGVTSAEAFITVLIASKATVTGISSAAAFGSVTITLGNVTRVVTGVVSSEAFTFDVVNQGGGPSTALVVGISSSEAFSTVSLSSVGFPTRMIRIL